MPRVRRPLLALIVLLFAVAIGYAVDALSGGGSGSPRPTMPAVVSPTVPGPTASSGG